MMSEKEPEKKELVVHSRRFRRWRAKIHLYRVGIDFFWNQYRMMTQDLRRYMRLERKSVRLLYRRWPWLRGKKMQFIFHPERPNTTVRYWEEP